MVMFSIFLFILHFLFRKKEKESVGFFFCLFICLSHVNYTTYIADVCYIDLLVHLLQLQVNDQHSSIPPFKFAPSQMWFSAICHCMAPRVLLTIDNIENTNRKYRIQALNNNTCLQESNVVKPLIRDKNNRALRIAFHILYH